MILGELHAVSASVRTVYMIFTEEGEFIEDFTIDYIEKGEDFSRNIVKRDNLIQRGVEVTCISATKMGYLEVMLTTCGW